MGHARFTGHKPLAELLRLHSPLQSDIIGVMGTSDTYNQVKCTSPSIQFHGMGASLNARGVVAVWILCKDYDLDLDLRSDMALERTKVRLPVEF